jgi:penicillin amidase
MIRMGLIGFVWRLAFLLCGVWVLCGPTALASPGAGQVEIVRDRWGIPHIYAQDESSGFFGLGYAAAQDRRLQMELIRRRAAGRLAEVFGPDWIPSDREARIAGHTHSAPEAYEALPERWKRALSAYADGVNAWTEANGDAVARRFRPLGVGPEPWTASDCLLALRGILVLGSPFSYGPVDMYHRFQALVAEVGEEEAAQRSTVAVDDHSAIVPESEMARLEEVYARLKGMPRMPWHGVRLLADTDEPKMSHAWAVGGTRSTTGKPILQNDPQLPLSTPPFFYEFAMIVGEIEARGLGFAGCPGLFVGWNRAIAWGGSALGVDAHVTYIDRLTPDRTGYVYEGASRPYQRRLEVILVRGGEPVVQEVLRGTNGVVFNALVTGVRPGEACVLYDPAVAGAGTNARMMLEVMTATNWDQFRDALKYYYSPGLHVVYADTAGNIGYQTLVHRPLTRRSPRMALEGWTGNDRVLGRIPLEDLPHMLNPAPGFISHANNMPVGSWYPYDLGLGTGGAGHTNRSLRLLDLLTGERRFSPEDFERVIHRDDVNAFTARLLPVTRRVVEEDGVNDPGVLRVLEATRGWDFRESSAAAIPEARGLSNAVTPYRGAGLNAEFGGGSGGVANMAQRIHANFVRDGTTPQDPRIRRYLVDWLRLAAGSAQPGRGAARDGAAERPAARAAAQAVVRTITIPYQRAIPHNLPVVDPRMDLQSPPLSSLDVGTIWSQPGNVYSQIVDLSDIDNSRAMIAPGNAEDGRFRDNHIDLWVRGSVRPAPLSRRMVEAQGDTTAESLSPLLTGIHPVRFPDVVQQVPEGVRVLPAIPRVAERPQGEPARAMPGRAPSDQRLEAAFRVIMRQDTAPAEIDARIAECLQYVRGHAGLTTELRNAAILGEYLIVESAAGRLRIQYGSPHALQALRGVLDEIGREGPRRP